MTSRRSSGAKRPVADAWPKARKLARKRNMSGTEKPKAPRRGHWPSVTLRRTSTDLACGWQGVVAQAFNDTNTPDRRLATLRWARPHLSCMPTSHELARVVEMRSR